MQGNNWLDLLIMCRACTTPWPAPRNARHEVMEQEPTQAAHTPAAPSSGPALVQKPSLLQRLRLRVPGFRQI